MTITFTHSVDVPTWDDLMQELTRDVATVLIEEKGPLGEAFHRIVVRRAGGDVWEARKAYHHRDRVGTRWSAADVAALERAQRQEDHRAMRLRSELEEGRGFGVGPTWITLAYEVAQGEASVLDCERDLATRITRMVVRRADQSVWEVQRPPAGVSPQPAIRWTQWEVDNLLDLEPDDRARNLRLGAHMTAALERARRTPSVEVFA